jgi:hypothetical protein
MGAYLFVGNADDHTIPFPAMLHDIAAILRQNSQNDLGVPAYEEHEDFVEGTLRAGGRPLRVYYEYSLGYLSLMSDDKNALQDVADRLQPNVMVNT